GLQVATVESLTIGRHFDDRGRPVTRQWDPAAQATVWLVDGTNEPAVLAGEPVYRRTLLPAHQAFPIPSLAAAVILLMMLAPVAFGAVLAVLMWHVTFRRLLLFLTLPALAAIVTLLIFHVDEYHLQGSLQLITVLVLSAAVAQMGLMVVGMRLGRPVARFFITYFIPPKPRQALAFLWTVDGKAPPTRY
ncbi:MAG: hypothetical protein NZ561_04605, partial [Phycisphaerae bacterium]|nr:hypothetical protein [Phycisphaerae bacterium]